MVAASCLPAGRVGGLTRQLNKNPSLNTPVIVVFDDEDAPEESGVENSL